MLGDKGVVARGLKWGSTTGLWMAVCKAVNNLLGPAGLGKICMLGNSKLILWSLEDESNGALAEITASITTL